MSFHSDSPMSEEDLPANSSRMSEEELAANSSSVSHSHLSAHTESFGQSSSSLEKGLEDDLNLSDSSEEGEEVAARQHPESSESSSDSDSSDSDSDTEVGESDVEDEGRSKEVEVEICGNFQEPLVKGWQRECITWQGQVVRVYYLSPSRGGCRRRLRDRRAVKKLLGGQTGAGTLSPGNFSFHTRLLDVEGEVVREGKASRVFTYRTAAVFHYWQEVEEGAGKGRSRRGKCSLCKDREVVIHRVSFPGHMQGQHLPDETCDICGGEFRPMSFRRHWEACDGLGEEGREEGRKNKLDQFWLETVSEKNRKGQCLLCPGYDRLICYSAFRRHMQRYHLPSEPCSKCGETFRPLEVKQHQEECLGHRGDSSREEGGRIASS